MVNKRLMIINQLKIMKNAAQEINNICGSKDGDPIDCPQCPANKICNEGILDDIAIGMKIPEE